MKSSIVKRSVIIAGQKTSVSLEDAFWEGLKDIAKARRTTLSDLVTSIDTDREHGNLSSTLRLWVIMRNAPRPAWLLITSLVPASIPTYKQLKDTKACCKSKARVGETGA